ncbi:MAG: hypothetical protein IJH81_02340 [Lachnospiraceae bacterium]|nr:hypothetical protein [Lachnospiraceae bacterium]
MEISAAKWKYSDLIRVLFIIECSRSSENERRKTKTKSQNGNIDGFLIQGNKVHDNNNIGIDMIAFCLHSMMTGACTILFYENNCRIVHKYA